MRRATMIPLLAGAAMALGTVRAAGQDSTAAAADPGKAVFEANCAVCHGSTGKGDGPGGAGLEIPPRNFTTGEFKYGADLASVEHTIGTGVQGTAMPAWGTILKAEEIEAVAKYVMAFSPGGPTTEAPSQGPPAAPGHAADKAQPQAQEKPAKP
jgi:cbb3-type cytochrome c oxidase subunit III